VKLSKQPENKRGQKKKERETVSAYLFSTNPSGLKRNVFNLPRNNEERLGWFEKLVASVSTFFSCVNSNVSTASKHSK